jgi:TPR repeat protein
MSAQTFLGEMYCSGDGVKQDYRLAAYWLGRAAVNPEITPHFFDEPEEPRAELAHLYR